MCRRFRNRKLKDLKFRAIKTPTQERKKGRFTMKYLRYAALLALLALPLAYSQAQVRVGVGIGVGGYVAGPPACSYGYYPDYPYACAPYGYWGPSYFANGVFIGAGPWFHGWGRGYYGGPYARGYVGRGFEGRGYVGHGYEGRGFEGRGGVVARGGESHGGESRGGRGGSHGGARGR
jgi:hypothetical protein